MDESKLLERITFNPSIFGGKPILRGRRLEVEHVLGMMSAGDSTETILEGYPWLEKEDVQACLESGYWSGFIRKKYDDEFPIWRSVETKELFSLAHED